MESNNESNISLEDMTQLEKLISFLYHSQLVALEQISTKLKCAFDGHFSVTNHLIVGPLAEQNTIKYVFSPPNVIVCCYIYRLSLNYCELLSSDRCHLNVITYFHVSHVSAHVLAVLFSKNKVNEFSLQTMESNISLESMPQLVLDKIISFLNHRQLLSLEQVSTKLKYAVDGHFYVTNHLVVGPLPELLNEDCMSYEEATINAKCLEGFLRLITLRCGPRLRTIQITITGRLRSLSFMNYIEYFRYLFESHDVAEKCPNIENIITFPKMERDYEIFNQRNIALFQSDMEKYATKIRLSTGRTCKVRSMSIYQNFDQELQEQQFKRILFLYSNVEQISVDSLNNFCLYLPQFIENGLKDFKIFSSINVEEAENLLDIGRNLRTLMFTLRVESKDDVKPLNRLRLHSNAKVNLKIGVDCIEQLKENICNYITKCDTEFPLETYTSMDKLKNLEEVHIRNLDQMKVIAEGSFEKLKIIRIGEAVLWRKKRLSLKFVPMLLYNKGKQLTVIDIRYECHYSLDNIWKSLKHCKAAEIIKLREVAVHSRSRLRIEDVKAIYNLPRLQHLRLSIPQEPDRNSRMLCELLRKASENTYFKFKYQLEEDFISEFSPFFEQIFTLDRINL